MSGGWCYCVPVSHRRRCSSHGTTVAVLQGVVFLTATDGSSVCACVRITVGSKRAPETRRQTHCPVFFLKSNVASVK